VKGEVRLLEFMEWPDEQGVDQNVPSPPLSPRALARRGLESSEDHHLYLDAYAAFRRDVGPAMSRPYIPAGLS